MKETNRQKKFSNMIQQELSEIFQREFPGPKGTLVTVSVVRATVDLQICKVYISILPANQRREVVEYFQENEKKIRKLLANRIRHTVRVIPELYYFEDDTLDQVDHIHKLLSDIKKDGEKE